MEAARSGSANSARTITASSWTGPPTYTIAPSSVSTSSGGTASATVTPEGRFRTTPIAPCSPCSPTRTTVRRKFGSTSWGAAIRSCPRSEVTTRRSLSRTRVAGARPGGSGAGVWSCLGRDLDGEALRDLRAGIAEHPDLELEVACLERLAGENPRGLVEREPGREAPTGEERLRLAGPGHRDLPAVRLSDAADRRL